MKGVVFQNLRQADHQQRGPGVGEPVEGAGVQPLVDEARVQLEGVAPSERRHHRDRAIRHEDCGPYAASGKDDLVHDHGKAHAYDQLEDHRDDGDDRCRPDVAPEEAVLQDDPVVAQADELFCGRVGQPVLEQREPQRVEHWVGRHQQHHDDGRCGEHPAQPMLRLSSIGETSLRRSRLDFFRPFSGDGHPFLLGAGPSGAITTTSGRARHLRSKWRCWQELTRLRWTVGAIPAELRRRRLRRTD